MSTASWWCSRTRTALGRAHDLVRPLPGQEGKAALLGDLLTVLLASYDDLGAFSGRVRVSVPRMGVGEGAATTLAMVVHELATNSLKYGALSQASGLLDVSCDAQKTDVVVIWTERNGPPVIEPAGAAGFGTRLVRRSMADQLGGSIEQDFNSLDAQREACEAYIASQKHEGWNALTEMYDDGGFSGATMERPALKRLLADVGTGKIDVVVVYKVDRLTRALSDFAKIVEIFDERQVSFVSVTQAFNRDLAQGTAPAVLG